MINIPLLYLIFYARIIIRGEYVWQFHYVATDTQLKDPTLLSCIIDQFDSMV
jgi:hypothetical protein